MAAAGRLPLGITALSTQELVGRVQGGGWELAWVPDSHPLGKLLKLWACLFTAKWRSLLCLPSGVVETPAQCLGHRRHSAVLQSLVVLPMVGSFIELQAVLTSKGERQLPGSGPLRSE